MTNLLQTKPLSNSQHLPFDQKARIFQPLPPLPRPLTPFEAAKLKRQTRAEILDYLFAVLKLADADRTQLARGGLSDREIDALGFRSAPTETGLIFLEHDIFAAWGGGAAFVPGFFYDGGAGVFRLNIRPGRGLLLPEHDGQGRVISLRQMAHAGGVAWPVHSPPRARLQRFSIQKNQERRAA